MTNRKTALVFNVCILVLEVLALAWMASGLSGRVLSASRVEMFKYFTIDSNVLMGIAALIAVIEDARIRKGKQKEPSVFRLVAQLTGTVGVTLTMLVTIFFLAPTMGPVYGVWSLFAYSNFFLHLLNPILSIVVFLGFERSEKIPFRYTFVGIIPLVIYAVYYTVTALVHMENGAIAPGYDWYGFFIFGIRSAFIVLPAIIAITYGISVLLWKLNRRKTTVNTKETKTI